MNVPMSAEAGGPTARFSVSLLPLKRGLPLAKTKSPSSPIPRGRLASVLLDSVGLESVRLGSVGLDSVRLRFVRRLRVGHDARSGVGSISGAGVVVAVGMVRRAVTVARQLRRIRLQRMQRGERRLGRVLSVRLAAVALGRSLLIGNGSPGTHRCLCLCNMRQNTRRVRDGEERAGHIRELQIFQMIQISQDGMAEVLARPLPRTEASVVEVREAHRFETLVMLPADFQHFAAAPPMFEIDIVLHENFPDGADELGPLERLLFRELERELGSLALGAIRAMALSGVRDGALLLGRLLLGEAGLDLGDLRGVIVIVRIPDMFKVLQMLQNDGCGAKPSTCIRMKESWFQNNYYWKGDGILSISFASS